jgi:hypothetical protein
VKVGKLLVSPEDMNRHGSDQSDREHGCQPPPG